MSAGTKVAHTPGPWKREDDEIATSTHYVATVAYSSVDDPGELRANAHLIAAAPDLLEALEVCADHIASSSGLMGDDPMVKQARTAIAKARGQS